MATRVSFSSFGKQVQPVDRQQFVGHGTNGAADVGRTRTPVQPASWVSTRHQLVLVVADAIRQMRAGADGLTAKEHDRLKQFSNGQYLSGVLSLVEIGQKCADLSAATAFPEALRGFQVQHHPVAKPTVMDAFRGETDANGEFDLAQLEYAAQPTDANRRRAIEAGNRQLAETYRALNALHAARAS